jgi:hypothetical protein
LEHERVHRFSLERDAFFLGDPSHEFGHVTNVGVAVADEQHARWGVGRARGQQAQRGTHEHEPSVHGRTVPAPPAA